MRVGEEEAARVGVGVVQGQVDDVVLHEEMRFTSSLVFQNVDEVSRAVGTRGCDCVCEARLVYWDATLIPRGVLGDEHVTSHIRCMCDVLSEQGDECCAGSTQVEL